MDDLGEDGEIWREEVGNWVDDGDDRVEDGWGEGRGVSRA